MHYYRDGHLQLGEMGETEVAQLIRGRGHAVRVDGGNHLHDLVVNGRTTVEVKTALPTARDGNRHDWWQFNLTKNDGHHAAMAEDVLVLRCQVDLNGGGAHHYVIPGSLRQDLSSKPGAVQPEGGSGVSLSSHVIPSLTGFAPSAVFSTGGLCV